MWEQPLSGLIKALRASKDDEARVIRQALDEIRREVASADAEIKAGAVLKLCYLEMLGYANLAHEAFRAVECMADSRFHIKQIGYLAAAQSFGPKTEVAMLITNLVKKDLSSTTASLVPLLSSASTSVGPPVLSLTLSTLPHLLTNENAADLMPNLQAMLTHSRLSIRRRTVLVLHSVARLETASSTAQTQDEFDGLGGRENGASGEITTKRDNVWVERLRERLRDDDQGVVGAAVSVVCELAMQDPVPWLEVAPELYGLLTAGNNNWMLIKIVKLFAVLTPIEPRLVKKLMPPLSNLIATTAAMSLLYECIHTCIAGGLLLYPGGDALAATCVSKLSAFLEDSDQNLRYIALVALGKLLPTHSHLVSQHRETIMTSVDDPDETIRMRVLDLIRGMVDRSTLEAVVTQLIGFLDPLRPTAGATSAMRALQGVVNGQASAAHTSPIYRQHLVSMILDMCSRDIFANIPDFEWYIDLLVRLAYTSLTLPSSLATDVEDDRLQSVGGRIAEDLRNVCARVKAIREYAARAMTRLLQDETFLGHVSNEESRGRYKTGADLGEVVACAAWIVGEYSSTLSDVRPVISTLFAIHIRNLPRTIISQCIFQGTKVFSRWATDLYNAWQDAQPSDLDQLRRVIDAIAERSSEFIGSEDVELQERSAEIVGLMNYLRQGLEGYKFPVAPIESSASDSTKPAQYNFNADDGFGDNPFASTSVASLPQPEDESTVNDLQVSESTGPECLSLLQHLFFSHELNAVATNAQSMVAPPEGLDLEAWLIPANAVAPTDWDDDGYGSVDEYGRSSHNSRRADIGNVDVDLLTKPKKKKKRDGEGNKKSRKGKEKVDEEEDEEDADEVELIEKARAERLERQKNDPYYIPTSRPKSSRHASSKSQLSESDIDSIPIVKLDLDPVLANQGDIGPIRSRSKPKQVKPMRPPPVIEIEGEMPSGHLLKPTPPNLTPRLGTPDGSNGNKSDATEPRQTTGELIHDDEDIGVGVTVTRVVKRKKKKKDKAAESNI